ncbi:MAG: GMC family oxidoreductase [Anaerolineaceae bacterium]|nr:GMC family oxidoreductase [Anaerolineaceae bacterium]
MTESTVAIIGSGIAGTTIAYLLAQQGIDVHVFEKGPDYAYPQSEQFVEEILNQYDNPAHDLDRKYRQIVQDGDIPFLVDNERFFRVGGMATRWGAITLRMHPIDLAIRTHYGRGEDWPITYDELEPYYCRAETLLGVSGNTDDNPFTPPRSQPLPLPPFELSYTERVLGEKLRDHNILLHTTPQARTRTLYETRPGCQNYGVCRACPLGARYSPGYHMQLAQQTGFCTLQTNVSVRRINVDQAGVAQSVLVHNNQTGEEWEHSAQVFVLAPGTIETVRLLMLSANDQFRDGLGNSGGQLGKRLGFHQIRYALLRYPEPVFPGRAGPHTAESHQFIDHEDRGSYGGVKIEFIESEPRSGIADPTFTEMDNLQEAADFFLHTRWMWFHAESDMTDEKYVTLSDTRDPFGDRIPHIHHQSSTFDAETYAFSQRLFQRLNEATGTVSSFLQPYEGWTSWSHHLGTCRMGTSPDNSVVDPYCQVHGIRNLFTAGSSSFVETSPVNPTLTIVALAIRTADYIMDQRLK